MDAFENCFFAWGHSRQCSRRLEDLCWNQKTTTCKERMKLTILCFLFSICACTLAAQQKYSVKGRLLCGDRPSVGTLVKLVDKDVGLDDTLGRVNSGNDGSFQVEGSASGGLTGIDPTVKIYHNCNGGGALRCSRRWRMKLPKSYIVNANQPSKWFDLGILNLQVKLEHSEDRDCI